MAVWSRTNQQEISSARRIDSEFFQPEYAFAEQRVRACDVAELGRIGGFVPGPFGSAFHVKNYDFKSRYRYIRGKDVKPFFLLSDDNRYLPASDFHRLSQYEVRKDDLMISVVGTLGNVAICTEEDVPAMFSCKSTLFRSKEADPYFLLAYLNSAFGLSCMLRRQRGAIPTGLNIEDLRTIPVPRFGETAELSIAGLVRTAHKKLLTARQACDSAQKLLASELGLDKLIFRKPVGYTARFSEVSLIQSIAANRIDAQCFSPSALQYERVLSKMPSTQPLRFLTVAMINGAQQEETPSGDIPYVSIKHIQQGEIVAEGNSRLFDGMPIAKRDDLLLAITGATIGKIGIVSCYDELTFSGDMLAIRTNGSIDPYFLLAFLSHRIGQVQLQRWITGSTNGHLAPRDVGRVSIPRLDEAAEAEIAALTRDSIVKIHELEQLLEVAKTRVEQLIEEAAGG